MVPEHPITNPASLTPDAEAAAAWDTLIGKLAAAYAARAATNPAEADHHSRYLAATRAQRDRYVAGEASPVRAARAKAP